MIDDATNEFTLETARRAGRDGRLEQWVTDFLDSPGSDNGVLALKLAERPRWWLGPVRVPLARLVPLAGPDEEQVVCPIPEEEWEDDVGDMVSSLEQGWEPPPLLVSFRDGALSLEDGNHRHESLVRAGEQRGWAIVCCDHAEDRDRVLAMVARRSGDDGSLGADRPAR